MKGGAVEGEVGESVEADVDIFFVAGVAAIVIGEPAAVVNVWSVAALDGHSAVADAASVGLDALVDAELVVDGELVLVAPEPKNGAMNNFRQLPRGNLIPGFKARVRSVMREQNQSALVALRIHRGLQPVEQRLGNIALGLEPCAFAKPFEPLDARNFCPIKLG